MDIMELATSMDVGWTLVAAALVFFMQAGFAMVETGFTRSTGYFVRNDRFFLFSDTGKSFYSDLREAI